MTDSPNNRAAETVDIRAAQAADLPAILELLPQLADFDIPEKRDPKDLWEGDAKLVNKLFAGETSGVFCDLAVDKADQVLGLALVSLREELLNHHPSAHLEGLVVSPKARGTGLGRTLLSHAEALAIKHGAQSLTLHVFAKNQRARSLYDSSGFDSELIRAIKWLD